MTTVLVVKSTVFSVTNSVAKGLTSKEYHDIKMFDKTYRVKVTPFLNGEIKHLKVCG